MIKAPVVFAVLYLYSSIVAGQLQISTGLPLEVNRPPPVTRDFRIGPIPKTVPKEPGQVPKFIPKPQLRLDESIVKALSIGPVEALKAFTPLGRHSCRVVAIDKALISLHWAPSPPLPIPKLSKPSDSLEDMRQHNYVTGSALGMLTAFSVKRGMEVAQLTRMACAGDSLTERMLLMEGELANGMIAPDITKDAMPAQRGAAWGWFGDYQELAFAIHLQEPVTDGSFRWSPSNTVKKFCDRTTDQSKKITDYNTRRQECQFRYRFKILQGADPPAVNPCDPPLGITPYAGVCMDEEGYGTSCLDDPDVAHFPYLGIRGTQSPDSSSKAARDFRVEVTALTKRVRSLIASGSVGYDDAEERFHEGFKTYIAALRDEKSRRDGGERILAAEMAAIEILRGVISEEIYAHKELNQSIAKRKTRIAALQKSVSRLKVAVTTLRESIGRDNKPIETAYVAARSDPLGGKGTYDRALLSDRVIDTWQRKMGTLLTKMEELSGEMSSLANDRATLLVDSATKATLQFRIEVLTHERDMRTAQAESERLRLGTVRAGYNQGIRDLDGLQTAKERVSDQIATACGDWKVKAAGPK